MERINASERVGSTINNLKILERVERSKLSGDIAESIMALRKCAGLSQSDFAEQYNIPVATIRDWEQGRRKCPEYMIELLEYKIKNEKEI